MINEEDGFSSPLAITVIFSLSLLICSMTLILYVNQKKVNLFNNYYKREKSAESLCKQLIKDFQIIREDKNDSFNSYGIKKLLSEYSSYQIQIKDVSTGINLDFLKKNIKENRSFEYLLNYYGDEITTKWGWVNPKYTEIEQLSSIYNDFNKKDLFPLINEMPLYNVCFMNYDFISAVLELCEVKDNADKAVRICTLAENGNITKEDLIEITQKNENDKIFDFLGTKTTFWEINLEAYNFNIELIVAAVPEKQNSEKVEKYVLINQDLNYKGVYYD